MPILFGRAGAGLCAAMAAVALAGPASAEAFLMDRGYPLHMSVTSFRDIPFKTVVRQQFDYSCGSAAVATLLTHHFGRRTRESDAFNAMFAIGDQEQIKKVGFSLLDMKKYLNSLGYKAEGYEVTPDDLKVNPEPSITMITVNGYRHFVVIKGFRDGQVLVGDPAMGLRSYPMDEFQKMWQRVILVIEDAGKPAFNREAEWRPYGSAIAHQPLSDESLAAFDRELPPRYQISPVFEIPPSTSWPQ